jgi:hypothetical protein
VNTNRNNAGLLSGFVVDSLQPERLSEQGRAYQLNDTSVSPVRIIGHDKFGNPIEETICTLGKWANFVDRMGNVVTIPLQTGRIPSRAPEVQIYEQITVTEQIGAGSIPLEMCPHAAPFGALRGKLVSEEIEEGLGTADCGGRPGAERLEQSCPHMQALIKVRRKLSVELDEQRKREYMQMTPAQAAKWVEDMRNAFGIVSDLADQESQGTKKRRFNPERHKSEE